MLSNRYNRIALPIFFLMDASVILGVYFIISYFFTSAEFLSFGAFFALVFTWAFPSLYFRSYRVTRSLSTVESILPTVRSTLLFILIYFAFLALGFLPVHSPWFHAMFIFISAVLLLFIVFVRIKYIYSYRLSGKNTRYSVLVTSSPLDEEEIKYLTDHAANLGYIFYDYIFGVGDELIKRFYQTIRSRKTDVVFVLDETGRQLETDQLSLLCDEAGIRMNLLVPYTGKAVTRSRLPSIGGYPVISVRPEPLVYLRNRAVKRFVDIIMSLLSIVFIMTWLPIVVKIAQWIFYPGPLFFIQDRIGRDGKLFKFYKFRTMVYCSDNHDAEKGISEKTSLHDTRVPWFGKLLRRTNLDEYPQFINVLLGSMSTVGPRPHMVGEDMHLADHVHKYRVRRFVKPGITGWAAVNGYRGGTDDMELMGKRTEYDIWYLENWSLWLDIKIMAITIWQMLTFRIPKAY